ncbi:unnamed protein product [Phaeothamnion confervicola]
MGAAGSIVAAEREKPLDASDLSPETAVEEVRRLRALLHEQGAAAGRTEPEHHEHHHGEHHHGEHHHGEHHHGEHHCGESAAPTAEPEHHHEDAAAGGEHHHAAEEDHEPHHETTAAAEVPAVTAEGEEAAAMAA